MTWTSLVLGTVDGLPQEERRQEIALQFFFSGKENADTNGAALIIKRSTEKTLIESEPVSERIIRARFHSKYCELTIPQWYAPYQRGREQGKRRLV